MNHTISSPIRVLIPDGDSEFALGVGWCLARAPGVSVHFLAESPWAPVRFSRFAASFTCVSPRHSDDWIENVVAAARRIGVDVVLPVDERGVRLCSERSDEINAVSCLAPVPSTHAFDVAVDKLWFAEFLTGHGHPVPLTVSAADIAVHGDAAGRIEFPVIVKPTMGRGGVGVRRVNTERELVDALRRSADVDSLICQQYIDGQDVDCSVLCVDGEIRAYTVQRGIVPARRSYAPSIGVEFVEHPEVLEVVRGIVRDLNWTGVAHVDLRADRANDCVYVIELNPRFWGSLLASTAAGVNFPHLACLAALGIGLAPPQARPMRFLGGRAAVAEWASSFFPAADGSRAPAWSTSAGWTLRDPLPKLIARAQKLVGRSSAGRARRRHPTAVPAS